MFTGIVRAVGHVLAVEARGGDRRLRLHLGALAGHALAIGDSLAVNGVCLTVIERTGDEVAFDVSVESLSLTSLGAMRAGSRVNLEPAATPATALGGHIVSGHVDSLATLLERSPDARSVRFVFEVPERYGRYIAAKGSVCVDGVSLTVNAVEGCRFGVNIVPHTLAATIMDDYQPGTRVNLEVDVLARYVERLLDARQATPGAD